jgi:hypothetical protein
MWMNSSCSNITYSQGPNNNLKQLCFLRFVLDSFKDNHFAQKLKSFVVEVQIKTNETYLFLAKFICRSFHLQGDELKIL